MKARVSIYLSDAIERQLEFASREPGKSKSACGATLARPDVLGFGSMRRACGLFCLLHGVEFVQTLLPMAILHA
jgi:hypothetical protein